MESKQDFQAFRCLLLGRSNVGKTYNGLNWALELVKKKIFNPKRIVLISKTFKSDSSQKEFISYCQSKYKGFKDNNCFENVDIDFLSELFEGQKQIKDTMPSKLRNWLLVFDDQISSNLIKRQDKNPTLKNLFCIGRHYNISQIWMLQRFTSTIDPTCRDQFTIIAIFKQGNKKALIDLLQDYDESPDVDYKKVVKKMYQQYLQSVESNDGHGCFVINTLVGYGKGRLQMNLTADAYFDLLP